MLASPSAIGHKRIYFFVICFCLVSIAGMAQWAIQRPGPAKVGQPMPGGMPNNMGSEENIQYVTPRPLDTIVAKTGRGPLTILDLQKYVQISRVPAIEQVPPSKIAALPNDKLKELARWVAVRREAAAELDTSKDAHLVQVVATNLQSNIDRLILRETQKAVLSDDLTTPTQSQIQAYYDKNTLLFHKPFSFKMRQLLLTTYTPYTVKDGDTLESIAEQISGDKAMAANIRADNETRPLRREEGKQFKSLIVNEKLLVPMNKEQQQEVRERLESYLKELKKGVKFEDLAKKYSEAGNKGEISDLLPHGTTRPQILPEILQAAKATPLGQISPIFQTKHGFQVIQIVEKTEDHVQPLDEVRSQVANKIQQDEKNKKIEAFMDKLFQDPALKIKYDLFARGDKLTTSTAIANIGEDTIQWDVVKEFWLKSGRPTEPVFVNRLLRNVPMFQMALLRQYAKPELSNPNSVLGQEVGQLRIGLIGSTMISKKISDRCKNQITPEKSKSWYEAHKKQYTSEPTVHFALMVMALSAEEEKLAAPAQQEALNRLLANMKDQLQKIKSPEQFVDEAAQINETIKARGMQLPDTSVPMPLAQIPEEFKSQLDKLEPGHWSEPYIQGTNVISVLLRERKPAQMLPYKDATQRVEYEIFQSMYPEVQAQVEEEYAQKTKFSFVLDEKPATPSSSKG